MGQDLQAHDRKWLEGLLEGKQGTRSLETITGIELMTPGKVPGYSCPL